MTDEVDLVIKLRVMSFGICGEAADEIERLRALNAKLVKVLEDAEAWITLAPISPKEPTLSNVRAVIAKARGEA